MGVFTESTMTQTAGALITVLDTYLVANGKWSIHDAAAGTNHKVYKQEDATNNSIFYLSVDDNYTTYAIVNMWEGWNDTTHVGTGNDVASVMTYTTLYWRKGTSYGLSVNDLFMIYIDKSGYANYAGQLEREDSSKNMPVLSGSYTTTGQYNPSATWSGLSNGCGTGALFDENGAANIVRYEGAFLRTSISGGRRMSRVSVYNDSTSLSMGVLYNVCSDIAAGVTGQGFNGDIFDDNGQDWLIVGNTGGSNLGCSAIKKA